MKPPHRVTGRVQGWRVGGAVRVQGGASAYAAPAGLRRGESPTRPLVVEVDQFVFDVGPLGKAHLIQESAEGRGRRLGVAPEGQNS